MYYDLTFEAHERAREASLAFERALQEQAQFAELVHVALHRLDRATQEVERLAQFAIHDSAKRAAVPTGSVLRQWLLEAVQGKSDVPLHDRLQMRHVELRSPVNGLRSKRCA